MKSNLRKIISLIFVVTLFGCTSNQVIQRSSRNANSAKPSEPNNLPQTHQQFGSENLNPVSNNSRSKKVQVALFLPLSGKNKELGFSLFNSAAISLFNNDPHGNIELVLIDSKDDNAKDTVQAFKEIVNRNIKIVIGPVFSASIEAIENDVKQKKITAISLSNNQQLMGKTNLTGGIFLAGMIPESQIDKMVGYATTQKQNSFAVIAPSSQYGIALNTTFKEIIKRRDGYLITSEFYNNSSDKEIDRAVEHVINAFRIPHELAKSAKLNKDTVVNDSDRIYPQIIFVPESGRVLSKIAASIKRQNTEERKFILFGASQWDDASTLNDYNLVGSLFVAPESEKFRNFERNYYQIYAQFPPRISSIVYDLVASVATVVNAEANDSTPTFADFVNYSNPPTNSFQGLDGEFRFLPNGLVQRNFAVLKVGNGKFETVEKPNDALLKY